MNIDCEFWNSLDKNIETTDNKVVEYVEMFGIIFGIHIGVRGHWLQKRVISKKIEIRNRVIPSLGAKFLVKIKKSCQKLPQFPESIGLTQNILNFSWNSSNSIFIHVVNEKHINQFNYCLY